jgi:hypothetical protein
LDGRAAAAEEAAEWRHCLGSHLTNGEISLGYSSVLLASYHAQHKRAPSLGARDQPGAWQAGKKRHRNSAGVSRYDKIGPLHLHAQGREW